MECFGVYGVELGGGLLDGYLAINPRQTDSVEKTHS